MLMPKSWDLLNVMELRALAFIIGVRHSDESDWQAMSISIGVSWWRTNGLSIYWNRAPLGDSWKNI